MREAREGADALPPGLAEVWREARSGRAGLSDVRLEAEPDGTPAQYLAAPIEADGRVVGIIAVRLAPDAIDSIVRERSGLGVTGITYISGPDGELKAPLRPRPARPESAKRVLAVHAPVGVEGLEWILHAEVDEGEVEGQIAHALNRRLIVLIGGSTLLLAALAFLIARGLGRAVRRVIDELHRLVRDVLAGRLRSRARPDLMAADFRPVLAEINALIEAFEKQIEASRRLEGHLRDAQRLEVIGSLAGGIAHDFNNLLAHMRALAHILSEEARADGRDQAHLDDLTLALHRGADLVRQILTFSRPGQDRRGSLDLREAAAETLRLIKAALPAGIRLEFEPGSEPLPIVGDSSQVQQVVMNLCLNAVQAMQEGGGRLRVTLGREEMDGEPGGEAAAGAYARLTVEDDGPGMSEAVRRRIFEPFFTTKAPGQGSGLGLSVSAGIVMGLGGTIQVESREGAGSRFDVILPLA